MREKATINQGAGALSDKINACFFDISNFLERSGPVSTGNKAGGKALPNGRTADDSTGLVETLLAVKDKYDSAKINGIACAVKNAGVGVGLPDWGRVRLVIKDGHIHAHSAGTCIGQGLWTVLKMLTADITGLDENLIIVEKASTNDPDSGTQVKLQAARQTCSKKLLKQKHSMRCRAKSSSPNILRRPINRDPPSPTPLAMSPTAKQRSSVFSTMTAR